MDVQCCFFADLASLDVNKIHIVGRSVDRGPERHRVGHLFMEPDIFVDREEVTQPWADDTDNVAKQGDEDQASIESENKASTTRDPDGVLESIKGREPMIGILRPPAVDKEK